jgi:hypothetical protein
MKEASIDGIKGTCCADISTQVPAQRLQPGLICPPTDKLMPQICRFGGRLLASGLWLPSLWVILIAANILFLCGPQNIHTTILFANGEHAL